MEGFPILWNIGYYKEAAGDKKEKIIRIWLLERLGSRGVEMAQSLVL